MKLSYCIVGGGFLSKAAVWVVICFFLLLCGCANEDQVNDLEWFHTQDEAIEYGMKLEGIEKSAILSFEQANGETLIFFENFNALGVVNLAQSDKGYTWYRSTGLYGFQGDNTPYMSSGFSFQTYSGQKIMVLAGKVMDRSIRSMLLTGDGKERELERYGDSNFFYSVHTAPFNSLQVKPIWGTGTLQ